MKAPKFWNSQSGSLMPKLLAPISVLYRIFDQLNRSRQTPLAIPIPLICIGNVVAGGAGKTPVAVSVAKLLIKEGLRVHFLSRGYGGEIKGPERVVLDVHTSEKVGDEPLLLASVAPTWVSKNRVLGAKAAVEAGADVIVMDDGFQNRSLVKTISILVLDGEFGLGNGRLLPAGPLREPFDEALQRSDAVVTIGSGGAVQNLDTHGKPLFKANIVPHALQRELVGERVVAFAGIGRPEKFFNSLAKAGAEVVEKVEFADHYRYKQGDIMKLVERATLHNAALVTTRKDYVRLPAEARLMTTVFDIDLIFEQPQALKNLVLSSLGSPEHA
ncbi:tetraacyldisaccharide 4'-kinase [Sneathiella glossodoripedis]|uniref:tetraacyldisaccharide 4'-kinase n=1 Tax=Sneathiella glossodoripedis TaxID=418853 RepID=UPI00046FB5F8|nr:tetraacyldisaccharide 4'-kinase [Sneathiella glossodoripedis]